LYPAVHINTYAFLKNSKFREDTMKPKKDTKVVHTKNTRDTKNTNIVLDMPPAAG
jgi:hypothetical protein